MVCFVWLGMHSDSASPALKSLMKPEEVEDELRKAIEGLNLEDSSAT